MMTPMERYFQADTPRDIDVGDSYVMCFLGEFSRACMDMAFNIAIAKHGLRRHGLVPDMDITLNGCDQWTMQIKMPHLLADGIGTLDFIDDMFLIYGNMPVDIDPKLYECRENLHQFKEPSLGKVIKSHWQFAKFTPDTLQFDPENEDIEFDWITKELNLDDCMTKAKAMGVTLNDLLLYSMFRTLGTYVDKVRITMPVNMREWDLSSMPACNILSFCYLDRDMRKPLSIQSIKAETEYIKKHNMGHAMLSALRTCSAIPGGIRVLLKLPQSKCTTVLSNLGRIFHNSPLMCSDGVYRSLDNKLELVSFEALAKPRSYMPIGFTVNSYNGKLWITATRNHKACTYKQCDTLLRDFVNEIKSCSF